MTDELRDKIINVLWDTGTMERRAAQTAADAILAMPELVQLRDVAPAPQNEAQPVLDDDLDWRQWRVAMMRTIERLMERHDLFACSTDSVTADQDGRLRDLEVKFTNLCANLGTGEMLDVVKRLEKTESRLDDLRDHFDVMCQALQTQLDQTDTRLSGQAFVADQRITTLADKVAQLATVRDVEARIAAADLRADLERQRVTHVVQRITLLDQQWATLKSRLNRQEPL